MPTRTAARTLSPMWRASCRRRSASKSRTPFSGALSTTLPPITTSSNGFWYDTHLLPLVTEVPPMSRILVLYYSSYGHVELMAQAQAEGIFRVAGAQATVKRGPELTPPDLAKAAGFLLDQSAPIAQPDELEHYDAIIFGTPTRFGNMASQMRYFLDQTGGLWTRNALVGKIGSAVCSTASQHGGAGNHADLVSYDIAPPWHDCCRVALYFPGTD